MNKDELTAWLQPETPLERAFLQDPAFSRGCMWGKPRYGHPEGEVYKHIREVLDNIDRLDVDDDTRRKLRIIAFVHDTFKDIEDKGQPRDWSKHHSVYARKFLERFTDDRELLDITELHDEAYYVWRLYHLYQKLDEAEARLQALLERLGDSLQLYYLFFKCDTMTGDKNPAPLKWFERTVPGVEVHSLKPA